VILDEGVRLLLTSLETLERRANRMTGWYVFESRYRFLLLVL